MVVASDQKILRASRTITLFAGYAYAPGSARLRDWSMTEETVIPVIDFSSQDRREKAHLIVNAMETVGFLFLDKVPGHDEDELRKWVEWFWSFSGEKKMKIARRRYNPANKHVSTDPLPPILNNIAL